MNLTLHKNKTIIVTSNGITQCNYYHWWYCLLFCHITVLCYAITSDYNRFVLSFYWNHCTYRWHPGIVTYRTGRVCCARNQKKKKSKLHLILRFTGSEGVIPVIIPLDPLLNGFWNSYSWCFNGLNIEPSNLSILNMSRNCQRSMFCARSVSCWDPELCLRRSLTIDLQWHIFLYQHRFTMQ